MRWMLPPVALLAGIVVARLWSPLPPGENPPVAPCGPVAPPHPPCPPGPPAPVPFTLLPTTHRAEEVEDRLAEPGCRTLPVEWVDCSEAPCLVAVPPADSARAKACLPSVQRVFRITDGDARAWVVQAIAPPDWVGWSDPRVLDRVEGRLEDWIP